MSPVEIVEFGEFDLESILSCLDNFIKRSMDQEISYEIVSVSFPLINYEFV